VRGNLFDPTQMRPLPPDVAGPDKTSPTCSTLIHVARAISDPFARVYAFGQRWGPEAARPDKVFGFAPGNGVHDIHMNQGNDPHFEGDDGIWQDGDLLVHFPGVSRWSGSFLAFQSQAWHTDDVTGHAIEGLPPTPPVPFQSGDAIPMRILAAMVNPVGPTPERETVLLMNASPSTVDLTGWRICDRLKRRCPLPAAGLGPGELLEVPVIDPAHLGNDGGLITLLDAPGLKVTGVAYPAAEVDREGWTVTF
jgi:hypothetical protein